MHCISSRVAFVDLLDRQLGGGVLLEYRDRPALVVRTDGGTTTITYQVASLPTSEQLRSGVVEVGPIGD